MEYKPLPIGVDNFEKLVTRGYYFVDKTLLMRELLDQKSDVNLCTRPRRFGKTLTLSMLQYFFEDMRDSEGEKIDNSYLFEGLAIRQAGEKYLLHMGSYPVINMTLKAAKRPTYEGACKQLILQIAMEFQRHEYLLKGKMPDVDRRQYERLRDRTADMEEYCSSLQFLSRCLERYYGKKVIILIDEYDVPLENAYFEQFYEEMVTFMCSFFEAALKTNSSLEFAVITGCLRISKESIFTGLNNLNVISILSNVYDEFFGFTDGEVRKICEDYGLGDNFSTVKEWYDGYLFGNANVYNPWSVIKYMFDHVGAPGRFPESYWANTSSNAIVRKLIEMADARVKQEIEDLLAGGSIEKPIHEDITYDEVYDSMDNLWNFMFFTGYLRKVSERMDEDTGVRYLTMVIPNKEVRYIFYTKISAWFQEQVKSRDLSILYRAVEEKDTETMERELSDIFRHTIGMPDQNENYYHGIMTGLLTGMPDYIVKSNRESGNGRSDLFVLPVSRKKEAFVMEFKKAKRIGQMEERAKEALRQIEEKHYRTEVYDRGYDIISSYGIVFCGKDCIVRHGE